MTDLSIHIAGILGPILIAVTLTELRNLKIWDNANPSLIYLNGLFLFSSGVAIVHFHNIWIFNWVVVITFLGYLFLLMGLFRMFFPGSEKQMNIKLVRQIIIAVLIAGVYLTAKAYVFYAPPK